MTPLRPLPESALRLFSGYRAEELVGEEGRGLLCERLLEDGDSADLRWLLGEIGVAEVAAWFAAQGGRKLSPRSRAFWALVLGRESGPVNPVAAQLWVG